MAVTEMLDVRRPVVIGFLREERAKRRAALSAALATYCERHELVLEGVVAEPPHAPDVFETLLDSIDDEAGIYGLVVPSRLHLGRAPIAAVRADLVGRAGLRLLLVRSGEPSGDQSSRTSAKAV